MACAGGIGRDAAAAGDRGFAGLAHVLAVVVGDGGEAVESAGGIAEEGFEGRVGAGGEGLLDDAVSSGQNMGAVLGFKDQHRAAVRCLGGVAGQARAQAAGVDRAGATAVKQVGHADIDMLTVLRHPSGLALLQIEPEALGRIMRLVLLHGAVNLKLQLPIDHPSQEQVFLHSPDWDSRRWEAFVSPRNQ